jgi:hypothetical protein
LRHLRATHEELDDHKATTFLNEASETFRLEIDNSNESAFSHAGGHGLVQCGFV